ncbi:DUF4652 domain-containing protein [Fuchsiella alkaliacetigena]|uniref:DUF4652 domain-containing protein n=1 Tax=Fuchsiella alkaliacetigena TaxID=957042 RepID=UPI00200B43CB|nr:DUF4652 domain-containing protein [Fuchsiella alkaliacetigena]MCK8825912.1 DUF4652 domain-containing protein [Fuchsiella alkaliacetigena]
MKRLVFTILIAVTVLLVGCSSEVKDTTSEVLEYEGKVYNKSYQVAASTIYYSDERSILVKRAEELTLLNDINKDEFASYPVLAPDQKKFAYISPFEFELKGDVYLYDIENETSNKIIKVGVEKNDTAKVIKWLDNERLLTIIGFGVGTVSRGGDLYLYDLKTEQLSLIKEAEKPYEEIVDVHINEKEITVDIIEWDDQFMEFIDKQTTFNYEDLMINS